MGRKFNHHDGLSNISNVQNLYRVEAIFQTNNPIEVPKCEKEKLLQHIKKALSGIASISSHDIHTVKLEAIMLADRIFFRCYQDKKYSKQPTNRDRDVLVRTIKNQLVRKLKNLELEKEEEKLRITEIREAGVDKLIELTLEYTETDKDFEAINFYVRELEAHQNGGFAYREAFNYGYFELDRSTISSLLFAES